MKPDYNIFRKGGSAAIKWTSNKMYRGYTARRISGSFH